MNTPHRRRLLRDDFVHGPQGMPARFSENSLYVTAAARRACVGSVPCQKGCGVCGVRRAWDTFLPPIATGWGVRRYDAQGWWLERKVAEDINKGHIRGDTRETLDQLQTRLKVNLRWKPQPEQGLQRIRSKKSQILALSPQASLFSAGSPENNDDLRDEDLELVTAFEP